MPLKKGDTFGHWTVMRRVVTHDTQHPRYMCRCSCGNERSVLMQTLKKGDSQSCGCRKGERLWATRRANAEHTSKLWKAVADGVRY